MLEEEGEILVDKITCEKALCLKIAQVVGHAWSPLVILKWRLYMQAKEGKHLRKI